MISSRRPLATTPSMPAHLGQLSLSGIAEQCIGLCLSRPSQGGPHRLGTAAVHIGDVQIVNEPLQVVAVQNGKDGGLESHHQSNQSVEVRRGDVAR